MVCSVLSWESSDIYCLVNLHSFIFVIELQTDTNISSTDNNAQTKATDLKKSSYRSTYDQTSVKLVMAGTGCSDVAAVEHV
jgi:OTU domain-containing protein 3